jgi:(1->4)-alpha-D-glucan 1-alpha-D-glucosylmutase
MFVDPDGRAALDAAVDPETGARRSFREVAAEAKAEQVRTTFQPEVRRLRRLADLPELEDALVALPVYRTYIDPDTRAVTPADRAALDQLPPATAAALLDPAATPPELVVRFQQTTGAVMAKGIEDTALYRDVRLLALNEVGGDPDRFGISVADFHAANAARATTWPRALLAGTTHDTKRSADVRARIAVLSTMGDEWLRIVEWWTDRCAEHAGGGAGPDREEQLFALQTLVGGWPLSRERLDGYLVKAFREAKRHTTWVERNEDWEHAVCEVVAQAMADPSFAEVFVSFAVDVIHHADRISLGSMVLRCTVPGVPDLYQGDELWNHLLVDPDNRRPVDWDLRRSLLDHQQRGAPIDRFTAKLFTIRTLFALRAHCDGFAQSPYVPLDAPADVCAFARGHRDDPDVVVVVPVRPSRPIAVPCAPARDERVDLLAPLDAIYGARRPAVLVRADDATSLAARVTGDH